MRAVASSDPVTIFTSVGEKLKHISYKISKYKNTRYLYLNNTKNVCYFTFEKSTKKMIFF